MNSPVKIWSVSSIVKHPVLKLEIVKVNGTYGPVVLTRPGEFKINSPIIVLPHNCVVPPYIAAWISKNTRFKTDNGLVRCSLVRGIFSDGLYLNPVEWIKKENISIGYDVLDELSIMPRFKPGFIWDNGVLTSNSNVSFSRSFTNIRYSDYSKLSDKNVAICSKHSGRQIIIANVNKDCLPTRFDLLKERFGFSKKPIKENFLISGNVISTVVPSQFGGLFSDMHDSNIVIYAIDTKKSIRIFDICIDGVFITWSEMLKICNDNGLETVKLLYSGTWSFDKIKLADDFDLVGDIHTERDGIIIYDIASNDDVYEYLSQKHCLLT